MIRGLTFPSGDLGKTYKMLKESRVQLFPNLFRIIECSYKNNGNSIVMCGENSHQTVRQSVSHSANSGGGANLNISPDLLESYCYNVLIKIARINL